MHVEFVGHAGIVLTSGKTRLLMDGWFSRKGAFDASWYQLPANHHIGDRDWSDLTAVVVSHEHSDHLDPEFLKRLPDSIPIYVVAYGSTNFVRKIIRTSGRKPRVLRSGVEHEIGDIQCRIWIEESPMNEDSVWAFRSNGTSVVHTVDSRLTPAQMDEIVEYVGGSPDLLLVQCSGASWYPIVYENYDDEGRRQRSLQKREHKLNYALSMATTFTPKKLAICAGPPAFLDPELRFANADPSFPTPGVSKKWFPSQGYQQDILAPLPADAIDLATGEFSENAEIHAEFSWDRTDEYVEEYAKRMQPFISEVRQQADDIECEDIDELVHKHFDRLLELNEYFNERIDMTVCVNVYGEQSGTWLVTFGADPSIQDYTPGDEFHYRYRFHSRWLKRTLVDSVPWEDFFLTLRFSAFRDPDVYNDHLLGILKFNDSKALQVVEQYEKTISDETIVVQTEDGTQYEISRYCPHAGADMQSMPIEGKTITCLNHHYTFDLDTGKCQTGNCELAVKKLCKSS